MVESKSPMKRTRRTTDGMPSASASTSRRKTADSVTTITADERARMVETAAYYRAERRGFASGHEAEDWLAAEAEIDALIASVHASQGSSAPKRLRSRKPRGN